MLTAFEKNHMNFDHSELSKMPQKSFLHDRVKPSLLPQTVKNVKEFQWLIIEIDWSASVWLSLIQKVY